MNEQLNKMKAAIEARVKAEPAAVGRTAVERRLYYRTLRNAVVEGGWGRRQDGGFPSYCGPLGERALTFRPRQARPLPLWLAWALVLPQRLDAGCIGFETFLIQNLDKN